MDILDQLKQQIESNAVLIYMKGTPQMPQCGFSSRTCAALQQCGGKFAYVNILMEPEVHRNLPRVSDWPTFPQVFINGKLVGGCDIVMELFESGKLKQMVEQATTHSGADST